MSDRLDESVVIPGFDVLEGFGRHRELLSNFFELTLVQAGLSRAQLSEVSEDNLGWSGSPSESRSQSLVVRAPLTGKHARDEVGGTSRRAIAGIEDDVLSPAPLSGHVRAASPSLPEQGQDPPSQAVATENSADHGSPTRGVIPDLPLPLTEPVVVFSGEESQNAGVPT